MTRIQRVMIPVEPRGDQGGHGSFGKGSERHPRQMRNAATIVVAQNISSAIAHL